MGELKNQRIKEPNGDHRGPRLPFTAKEGPGEAPLARKTTAKSACLVTLQFAMVNSKFAI
jgi:hypothetical protein